MGKDRSVHFNRQHKINKKCNERRDMFHVVVNNNRHVGLNPEPNVIDLSQGRVAEGQLEVTPYTP